MADEPKTPESASPGPDAREPTDLTGVLDKLQEAAAEPCEHAEGDARGESVSIQHMLEAVGTRSFGTMLMVPGLAVLSPLSGIPGVPTVTGAMIFLISGQLLIGRKRFWVPRVLLDRCVNRRRFERALVFLEKPARWIDKPLNRRLTFLTRGPGMYAVALCCFAISLTMPPLELVPFAATSAGLAVTLFALSLIARDGLLALLGFATTATAAATFAYFLL